MNETISTTHDIEERRRRARVAAERCIDLLKEEFGARRVILFGSLAEQGVWHRHSDIDLAVEGLPPADFFKAYGACHNLVSPEFELDLDEFYNGIERIFERIVVGLGESLPRGTSWHVDLLVQIATAQKGKRPAVIDERLWTRLEEYLKFRHFFRHAYGHTLEWDRMRWNAEQLGDTLQMLDEQIHTFFDSLGQE